MNFSPSDDQLELAERLRTFGATLNDGLIDRDRSGIFPRSAWEACAEQGIHSMAVPGSYNTTGSDTDLMTAALALEGFGQGCHDNGLNLALSAHMWTVEHPIVRFGTDTQRAHFLPKLASGEWIGAHVVTEPEAGSDHQRISTTATPVEGGYLLSGVKRYITLGPVCDVALTFATTDPERGRWGMTAFIVETGRDGCVREPMTEKMGLRTVPMGTIRFEDCFVPEQHRLGDEGAGAAISSAALGVERTLVLATQVGTMARQLETSIAYARDRHQFGQPIGRFQSVSNRIADMQVALEVSRLLLYKTVWKLQQGENVTMEAAMLKLLISESFLDNSVSAVRTHGGIGYITDGEIERDLRDAVGGVIYAGTSDIQRLLIARLLGL